jgi:hypothetical protein
MINVMDADETRIITAFGVEEVLEVYKENLLKYRKYLLQHLARKTILTGREDFPCVSIFRPKRMLELLFILSFRWEMLMYHAVLRAVAPLPLLLTLLALATSASSWSGYELPEGQGVCLYTTPPQSTIPHFNDGWFDAASQTTKNCGGTPPNYLVLPDGTPCGGYLTELKDGSSGYPQALGYTCQTATYEDSTHSPQTAHLCMPPTGSGLGKCVAAATRARQPSRRLRAPVRV